MPATIEARTNRFKLCLNLAHKCALYAHRPRVAPDPPAITNMLENSPATAK